MYELVNTSLPNGLIVGTHGYATVAMTRGLPNALATRLDVLSAYAHRTSAHDARYARENPVNWQHLVLPQGEHVVSRIAPAPFDYTGRTNRLARHLCFTRGDPLPANGAAHVLEVARAWFTAPWDGEARWLEPDRALEGTLAAEVPHPVATAAPHWDALLGADKGLATARRVAQFVRTHLRAGGKSLSFRADAALDADGTRLLGLFADVIALLPPELRCDVTFSTYAAALPTGVGCLLRGVFDDTPAFKVTSAVQPWIDCVHGRIVHEELLPEWVEEVSCAVETKVHAVPSVAAFEKRLPTEVKPLSPLPRTTGTPPVRTLPVKMPPPWWRDGLVWAVVAALVLVLASGVAGMWYVLTHADAGNEASEETIQEEPLKRLVEQQRQIGEQRTADELRERRAHEEAHRAREARKAKELAGKEAERAERAKWRELAKKNKADKNREAEDCGKAEVDAAAKRAAAYGEFSGAVVWRAPDKDLREDCVAFDGKGENWVYYADAAGKVVPHKITVTKRANVASGTMMYRFEPDPKGLPTDVPFALWCAGGSRRLYWQWVKTTFANMRFENAATPIDVWALLTAHDADVGRALERSGFTLSYALEFTPCAGTAEPFTVKDQCQKTIDVKRVRAELEKLRKETMKRASAALETARGNLKDLENEHSKKAKRLDALKKKTYDVYDTGREGEEDRIKRVRKQRAADEKEKSGLDARLKALEGLISKAQSEVSRAEAVFDRMDQSHPLPTEAQLVEQWSFTIRVDVDAGRPDSKGEK